MLGSRHLTPHSVKHHTVTHSLLAMGDLWEKLTEDTNWKLKIVRFAPLLRLWSYIFAVCHQMSSIGLIIVLMKYSAKGLAV